MKTIRQLFKGLYKLCQCKRPNCLIPVINRAGIPAKFKHGHNSRGSNHPMWNGGRIEDGYGYWLLWIPDHYKANNSGYIREHVYFYEQYHKCCMLPWGEVHHIIPVKDGGSNMPWNLMGLMHNEHSSMSSKVNMNGRTCKICGLDKTKLTINKKTGKYYPHWYGNEVNGFICYWCYMKNYLKIYLNTYVKKKK